jgi:hypothetical protein
MHGLPSIGNGPFEGLYELLITLCREPGLWRALWASAIV